MNAPPHVLAPPARRPRSPAIKLVLTWRLLFTILFLLVGSSTALLWFAYQSEKNDRDAQVTSNTLWVSQSIKFQLERHAETLRELAQAFAKNQLDDENFASKARVILNSNHEIVRISHVDAEGRELASENVQQMAIGATEKKLTEEALVTHIEKYSLSTDLSHQTIMSMAVPIVGKSRGAVVISYSLDRLLNELVPWWLASENEVSIATAAGRTLAVHNAAAPAKNNYVHRMALDIRGIDLVLVTNSVLDTPRIIPHLMSGAIALLTPTLLFCLVILRLDIRRREKAEYSLSEQLVFRKAMENSLVTGLRARDMEGRITFVNPAFCTMVGFSEEELLGESWPLPFYDLENNPTLRRRFTEMLEGKITPQGYETGFIRKDGTHIHVLIHETALFNPDGQQTGWLSSILDISDRRRVEDLNRTQQERLQSTSRLVTMGEVASTLSHELNQPLSAITSYAIGSLNLLENHPDSRLREALVEIHRESERAGNVIRAVHTFIKRRTPDKVECNISTVIANALPLINLQARKWRADVVTTVQNDLPVIEADVTMLEQVLLNLTRNAFEAMAGQPVERRRLLIQAQTAADSIELLVVDHGMGISPEVSGKLFSPFFTTKPEGMGLGLNICRTAIELHHGRITVEETPGGGATFRINLRIIK